MVWFKAFYALKVLFSRLLRNLYDFVIILQKMDVAVALDLVLADAFVVLLAVALDVALAVELDVALAVALDVA